MTGQAQRTSRGRRTASWILVAATMCSCAAVVVAATWHAAGQSPAPRAASESRPDRESPTGDPWALNDWRTGSYESAYYSCPPDPETGCAAEDGRFTLDGLSIGTERAGVAFVDFRFTGDTGTWDGLAGPPDQLPAEVQGIGHGVRVTPLAAPPPGLGIGGASWLDVTVSAVSADEFAARPMRPAELVGGELRCTRAGAPTRLPVTVEVHDTSTRHIEALTLVSTTPDMMRWVISLAEPAVYEYVVIGYWGSGRYDSYLNITLRPLA